ncbi:MAG: 2OG-Fe(II) oxygenase [Bacteroidetes bacterium]|nr:MAG: 2OG-Fe(II) oxygenase [Bacteroidota bacterium]MBL1143835.1 2OG-Fe(II) oxygenase [Bacteroidota bacterium]MCB0802229.1 2OG-Fe(II) oxygenase [Flavobacteriales bacterium]NOG56636.1 2OG-Fe(II) oxygenase [Bacteroidota bacterium]
MKAKFDFEAIESIADNNEAFNKLDAVADSLAINSFAIIDSFLSDQESLACLDVLKENKEQGNFKNAGIGTSNQYQIDKSIRGDEIKWLDESNLSEANQVYMSQIQAMMRFFNRTLFLSLKDFECHFAHYPAGTFYKRHLDLLKLSDHRKLSFVFYLNPNWQKGDGGELLLYLKENESEKTISVDPILGRLVIFRSELLEHEVALANKSRYSITGWMLDQYKGTTFL